MITPDEVKAEGFIREQFNDPDDFDAYISTIIATEAALLEGRLGFALTSATGTDEQQIKRVLFCRVCADMLRKRLNFISDTLNDEGTDKAVLRTNRREYLEEAEKLESRIKLGTVASSCGGLASGAVISGEERAFYKN